MRVTSLGKHAKYQLSESREMPHVASSRAVVGCFLSFGHDTACKW